jgi:hypothetical protein
MIYIFSIRSLLTIIRVQGVERVKYMKFHLTVYSQHIVPINNVKQIRSNFHLNAVPT